MHTNHLRELRRDVEPALSASSMNGTKAKADTKYGEKAKSAILWNAGFNLFRDLLQFVQMLILARLLDDTAYGQFAFATGVIGFLAVFSATPFLSYTLQVKSDEKVHYQDHFTAGAVLQFSMFILANLAGLCIATIPSYADAAPLIHVLSLTFLLEWTCEIRRKMIERDFDFRNLRLLHGVGLLLATVTAIVMALTGCGVFSLAVPGMLVTLPFIWDLFIRQGWRPTWEFSWDHYQPAFSFGTTRIGSGLSSQGKTLMESSFLAAALGFGPLGILNRAIGLATLACTKIASQLMYAIYPILTRLDSQSGQASRAGDLILRLVLWTAIPIALCIAWLAAPVVNTIYGPKWAAVIPLMKWTLGLALATASTQVVYMLALARNRARLCLSCDLIVLTGMGLSLTLVLGHGVAWYLLSLTVIQLAVGVTLTATLFRDHALTRGGLILAIAPSVVCSMLGCAVATVLLSAAHQEPSGFLTAAIWGISFGVTYLICLRLLFSLPFQELIQYLPGRGVMSRYLRLNI